MSSPRPNRRNVLKLLAIGLPLGLAGCTLTPVYGDRVAPGTAPFAVRYAAPTSRFEQIVYQELRLRLGESQAEDAALVSVRVTTGSQNLTQSGSGSGLSPRQVVATGRVLVIRGTETILSVERRAAASYESTPQSLSTQEALSDAQERASKALAEQIRLTLFAALSPRG